MKNQNNKLTAVLFVVALALAPMVRAAIEPQGGPSKLRGHRPPPGSLVRPTPNAANEDASENSEAAGGGISSNLPVITVYRTDNVIRGKTGTFVLVMKPALMFGGTYVNFSLSGTAVRGVDYKVPVSPAYISESGYGTIQIETLPDLRGGALNQAYSVIVTLNAGAGYAVGKSNSAIMWIKP
jgi:hypothetical protein